MSSSEPCEASCKQRYVLSRELRGHTRDVRCACYVPPHYVATGSHDRTICLWDLLAGGSSEPVYTLLGHEKGIGALVFFTENGSGAKRLLSGGYDSAVFIWDVDKFSADPLLTLLGHTGAVVGADVNSLGTLAATSSWDNTSRIWDVATGSCIAVLAGHTSAVWACAWLRDDTLITGSADRSTKLWDSTGAELTTCPPVHTDCVRGIAVLPGSASFATASNDCTVAVWSADCSLLHRCDGHTSFVYDVRALTGGRNALVSTGEDRSARVWGRDFSAFQCIQHPATVWSCAALPDGEFVTCCSDGVARIWSEDPNKAVPEADRVAFEASCKSDIAAGAIGDVSVDSSQMATSVGSCDGDTRVFFSNPANGGDGKHRAYRWSEPTRTWELIGEVVTGPSGSESGSGGLDGNMYEGKRYDYVFDVELDGRMMKLPYNLGENPYLVAQKFIERENLQQEMLDDIAKHIFDHTPSGAFGAAADNSGYCDPFTGGNRYIPGCDTGPKPQVSLDKVPGYTVRDDVPVASSPKRRHYDQIPQHKSRTFAIPNMSAVTSKIALKAAPEDAFCTAEEVAALPAAPSENSLPDLALMKKLGAYPADSLLPVYGYYSVVALCESGATMLVEQCGVLDNIATAVRSTKSLHTIAMRLMTNLASTEKGYMLLLGSKEHASRTLEILTTCADNTASSCHAASCRFLFNVGVFSKPDTLKEADGLLQIFVRLIAREATDPMVTANLILGFCTLIWNCPGLTQKALSIGAADAVSRSVSSSNPSLKSTAIDMSLFLKGV